MKCDKRTISFVESEHFRKLMGIFFVISFSKMLLEMTCSVKNAVGTIHGCVKHNHFNFYMPFIILNVLILVTVMLYSILVACYIDS